MWCLQPPWAIRACLDPNRGLYEQDAGATWEQVLFVGDSVGINDVRISSVTGAILATLGIASHEYDKRPREPRQPGVQKFGRRRHVGTPPESMG